MILSHIFSFYRITMHSRSKVLLQKNCKREITFCLFYFDCRIPVHRVVLCAANSYFSSLLTIEMREKYQNEILIENIDGGTLQSIVEFCYSGKIKISKENVDDLLAAADMFQFANLKEKCIENFERMLEPVNCLGIIALAEQYNLEGLKASATTLAHNRFMEVINTEELVHLETPQLLELLSNDNINVDSEEDVFLALTKWIDFNLKSRQKHIKDLVQAIRVG